VVHRDVKPENIFVNPSTNKLQIGDFGLAKSASNSENLSGSNPSENNQQLSSRDLGGTLMYLSPEQKDFHKAQEQNINSSKQNDWLKTQIKLEKVDIYAAGLVLFELCSKFKTEMQKHKAFADLTNHRRF
jgi:serine/threonine protein kinase